MIIADMSSGFEGGLGDVAIEVLHMLLSYLLQHSEDELGMPSDIIEAFIQVLRRGKELNCVHLPA